MRIKGLKTRFLRLSKWDGNCPNRVGFETLLSSIFFTLRPALRYSSVSKRDRVFLKRILLFAFSVQYKVFSFEFSHYANNYALNIEIAFIDKNRFHLRISGLQTDSTTFSIKSFQGGVFIID